MTAADDKPELTEAGRAALEDKTAAAERIRAQAEADQRAAADAAAAQEKKRQQTAAARAARQRARDEQNGAVIDQAAADVAQPCEGCGQFQEAIIERLGRLETQTQAIGKLVVGGVVAGLVIWFLGNREKAAQAAALEGTAAE